MSKIEYSKLISEILDEKISNLQNYKVHEFFKRDELFEVALCMTYMTLTKEKIIDKDLKVEDDLARLTERVDRKEIERVLDPNIFSNAPVFDESITDIKDSVWRLDSIRDSIMHSKLDVDLDNKLFIIDNVKNGHKLYAQIPFSWFIDYAKNDILSKRQVKKYSVRGFFFNKDKKDNDVSSNTAIDNSILYNVYIKSKNGGSFNAKRIEDQIRFLFDNGSNIDKDIIDLSKYENEVNQMKNKHKYGKEYLLKFCYIKNSLIEALKNQYPDLEVRIDISESKHKIKNKVGYEFGPFKDNYGKIMYEANRLIAPKSMSVLSYLSNIIDAIYHNIYERYPDDNKIDAVAMFNDAINNHTPLRHIYKSRMRRSISNNIDYNLYMPVLLNVYIVNTLVINHEDDLYKNRFKDIDPHYFVKSAIVKEPFVNFTGTRTRLKKELLSKKIKLSEMKENNRKCLENNKMEDYQKTLKLIEQIKQGIEDKEQELFEASRKVGYNIMAPRKTELLQEFSNITYELMLKESDFYNENDISKKETLKDEIVALYEKLGEVEIKYVYSTEFTMEDVLAIIRNSASHVGRINLEDKQNIFFYDYGSNKSKSGEVIINYGNLMELLKTPILEMTVDKDQTMVL